MLITSKSAVAEILMTNGKPWSSYNVTPLVYSCIDLDGKEQYIAFAKAEHDDMTEAEANGCITFPVCLMANCIVTEQGKDWLKKNGFIIKEEVKAKKVKILTYDDVYNSAYAAVAGRGSAALIGLGGVSVEENMLFHKVAHKTCELLELDPKFCPICGCLYSMPNHDEQCMGEEGYTSIDCNEIVSAFFEAKLIVQYEANNIKLNGEVIDLLDKID